MLQVAFLARKKGLFYTMKGYKAVYKKAFLGMNYSCKGYADFISMLPGVCG